MQYIQTSPYPYLLFSHQTNLTLYKARVDIICQKFIITNRYITSSIKIERTHFYKKKYIIIHVGHKTVDYYFTILFFIIVTTFIFSSTFIFNSR